MDGILAVTVLVILGFVIFIFWAKSETGRKSLRDSLGEPGAFHKRRTLKKRPPASKSSSAASPSKRPASTKKPGRR